MENQLSPKATTSPMRLLLSGQERCVARVLLALVWDAQILLSSS